MSFVTMPAMDAYQRGPEPRPPALAGSDPRPPAPGPAATGPGGRLRVGVAIAVAVGVGFVVWLLVAGGGSSAPKTPPAARRAPAVAASEAQLRALAATKPFPLYWAGARPGDTYELSQTAAGNVYIRYLPHGVPVGINRPVYVTVGTYPQANGFATVTQASHLPGEYIHRLPRGGLAVSNPRLAHSVYLSYPGARYMVEVFDPAPGHARSLVNSGQVRPLR